jgi:hypothetical protein
MTRMGWWRAFVGLSSGRNQRASEPRSSNERAIEPPVPSASGARDRARRAALALGLTVRPELFDVPLRGSLGIGGPAEPAAGRAARWKDQLTMLLTGERPQGPIRWWHSQDFIADEARFLELWKSEGRLDRRPNEAAVELGRTRDDLLDLIAERILDADGRRFSAPPGHPSPQGDRAWSANDLVKHVARGLFSILWKEGQPPAIDAYPAEVMRDVAAYVRRNRSEIYARTRAAFQARVDSDVALFERALENYPRLSLEEARVALRERSFRTSPTWPNAEPSRRIGEEGLSGEPPHLTRTYVDRHVRPRLRLDRPVDRRGEEPNLLLAIQITDVMLRAPVGCTYQRLIGRLHRHIPELRAYWPDFGVAELELLQRVYGFIPRWAVPDALLGWQDEEWCSGPKCRKTPSDPTPEIVPEDLAGVLRDLRLIPFRSKLLDRRDELRGEGPVLAGRDVVSVELASNDVVGYLDHLIGSLGADGARTTIIWKPYADDPDHPADRLIPSLCQRMFGVRSIEPPASERLASITEAELLRTVENAKRDGRGVAAHILGVQDWTGIGRIIAEHPDVPFLITAHTSSDADAYEKAGLSGVSLVDMANSRAKHIYEREMLADGFQAALLEIEHALNLDIRHRDYLIHGMGRTVGPAALRALLRLDIPPRNIHVSDPVFRGETSDRPPWLLAKSDLTALGADVVTGEDAVVKLFSKPLVSINATPGDVLTPEMVLAVPEDEPLIHFQLGSNEKDTAVIRRLCHDEELGGSNQETTARIGRQQIAKYEIGASDPDDSGRDSVRTVVVPGAGKVLNHAFRRPIPTARTDFINLLKVESWYQADWNLAHGLFGPRTLRSVHVGYDEQVRGTQPIAILLPRDNAVEWAPSIEALRKHAEGHPRHREMVLTAIQDSEARRPNP